MPSTGNFACFLSDHLDSDLLQLYFLELIPNNYFVLEAVRARVELMVNYHCQYSGG